MPGPVKPVIPDRPGTVIHAIRIVQGLLIGYAVFLALFLKWLSPRPGPMAACILVGLPLGLGYSFLHHYNKARKERLAALVRPSSLLRFPAHYEGFCRVWGFQAWAVTGPLAHRHLP